MTSSTTFQRKRISGTVLECRRIPLKGSGEMVVGSVQPDSGAEPLNFVGMNIVGCDPGCTVIFEGRWENHAKYGRQFRVDGAEGTLPVEETTILDYIAHNIKYCGDVRARKIVRVLGADCLNLLSRKPILIQTVFEGKLGDKMLPEWQAWARRYHRDEQASRLVLRMMEVGLSHTLARRVQKFALTHGFGEEPEDDPTRNPYALTRVPGIGFVKADRIAKSRNVRGDDPFRLKAGLEYALAQAMGMGSSGMPASLLLRKAQKLLRVPARGAIATGLEELIESGRMVRVDGLVMLPGVDRKESRVADVIRSLTSLRREMYPEEVAVVEEEVKSMSLSTDQAEAVRKGLTMGVFALTGRPGSGKTTALRAVVRSGDRLGWKIEVAAPTGKAASRAAEVTGFPARTIHRLIGQPFGVKAPFKIDADVIVLDEASMIDLPLMHWLLDNIDTRSTSLILVGDPHQLPSVGHGRVFGDILESGLVEKVELTRVFRQSTGSLIVENAHNLLDGKPLDLGNEAGVNFLFADISKDDEFTGEDGFPVVDPERPRREQEEALSRLRNAMNFLVHEKGADPARDIQVLTPMKKGTLGMESLNDFLQGILNPAGAPGPTVGGGATVRRGDRVIQTRNDYDVDGGLFNGEQGVVTEVGHNWATVDFGDRRIRMSGDQLASIHLAWAITVHRAQGSEFPYTILLYHTVHHALLETPLLYTAVTRAQKLFVLIANRRALELTRWRGKSGFERHTGLLGKLEA